MDQIQGCNCQYYPSYYSNYQAPASNQWTGQGYSHFQGSADQTYNCGANQGFRHNYGTYQSYSTPQKCCMGRCNPQKLYAETYSYLSENFVRPVVEEVYHDLKNITASNTVANNSEATKMGLAEAQVDQAPQGYQRDAEENQMYQDMRKPVLSNVQNAAPDRPVNQMHGRMIQQKSNPETNQAALNQPQALMRT